jgi:hypothetical protein
MGKFVPTSHWLHTTRKNDYKNYTNKNDYKLFLNWIQFFKLNSNTLNEIKIQLIENGMQIGAKDVENFLMIMVLKRKKL